RAEAHLADISITCAVLHRRQPAFALAPRPGQLAVHMQESPGAGTVMQVVDILCAKKESVTKVGLKLSQREMRGIGLRPPRGIAARGIELPDQAGIALPRLGCADVLDAVALP